MHDGYWCHSFDSNGAYIIKWNCIIIKSYFDIAHG